MALLRRLPEPFAGLPGIPVDALADPEHLPEAVLGTAMALLRRLPEPFAGLPGIPVDALADPEHLPEAVLGAGMTLLRRLPEQSGGPGQVPVDAGTFTKLLPSCILALSRMLIGQGQKNFDTQTLDVSIGRLPVKDFEAAFVAGDGGPRDR